MLKGLRNFSPICNSKRRYEFKLAQDIDPDYCKSLLKAVKKLNMLCYDCKFSSRNKT